MISLWEALRFRVTLYPRVSVPLLDRLGPWATDLEDRSMTTTLPPANARPALSEEQVEARASYGDRIAFGKVEADGRFELQILRDGEMMAFAMVDAPLAERIAQEALGYAELCRGAAASPPRATVPQAGEAT